MSNRKEKVFGFRVKKLKSNGVEIYIAANSQYSWKIYKINRFTAGASTPPVLRHCFLMPYVRCRHWQRERPAVTGNFICF